MASAYGSAYGTSGSALVVIDDQRSALAAVLVLQEMGLTVDVAADRGAALAWLGMARYACVVCGGGDFPQLLAFAQRIRVASPYTQLLMVGHFAADPRLEEINVELLQPPVNVNQLVDRLRPLAA